MSRTNQSSGHKGKDSHAARVFDIRTFIALLIGIYGVILVLTAIFATNDADLDKAGGVNVNLWAGIGMIVVAALFQSWAILRPVILPGESSQE